MSSDASTLGQSISYDHLLRKQTNEEKIERTRYADVDQDLIALAQPTQGEAAVGGPDLTVEQARALALYVLAVVHRAGLSDALRACMIADAVQLPNPRVGPAFQFAYRYVRPTPVRVKNASGSLGDIITRQPGEKVDTMHDYSPGVVGAPSKPIISESADAIRLAYPDLTEPRGLRNPEGTARELLTRAVTQEAERHAADKRPATHTPAPSAPPSR